MVKFKAIKQKREFDPQKVRDSILSEAKKIGKEISQDWRKPIESWDGVKPVIGYTVELQFHILTLFAGVKSGGLGAKKLGWLNDGTKPHNIRAHSFSNPLTFQLGYSAKTFPGVLRSTSGGSHGAWVRTMEVHHPGTKARKFDVLITDKWNTPFIVRMRGAYERGLKATGHGM